MHSIYAMKTKELKELKELPERQRIKILAAARKLGRGKLNPPIGGKRQAKSLASLPKWRRSHEPYKGLTWLRRNGAEK